MEIDNPLKLLQNSSIAFEFPNIPEIADPYALVRLQVKKNSNATKIELSIDILPTDPGCNFENDLVVVNFVPAHTRNMLGDSIFKYDLMVTRQGKISYPYRGSFEVVGTITRDGDSFTPVEYQSILEKLASTVVGFGAWMIGVDAFYWSTILGAPNLVLARCLRWLNENKLSKLNPFAGQRLLKSGATDLDVVETGITIDNQDNVTGVRNLSLIDQPANATHATRRDWVESEIATRLDVAINALVNGSPGALDTLQELANAMGNDPHFATTVLNALATKIPMSEKGVVNGVATLGPDGLIIPSQLPPSAASVTSVNGQTGVVVIPTPVVSVNGQTGTITIDTIPLGCVVEDPFDQLDSTRYKVINSQAISRTTYSVLWNLVNRTVASITPATDRINVTAHGCVEGQLVKFSFTGGGITALTNYYVRNPTANDFQISATATGAIIDLTSSQAGTMLVNAEYGFGDGSTTYNVPDRRGIFARGAGVHGTRNKMAGGNYDGGAVGYAGQDQISDHSHAITYNNVLGIGGGAGGSWFNAGTTGTFYVSIGIFGPIANGANGTPRLGNETTPAYVAVKYKVRVA
ncbi:hypothetical protein [Leptospira interrogans]|uniref:hypothetical protein n=1 Tax=Leptospira interrogans TaxID=173 RepID=UPI00193B9613|nr:hypothetical protein [Leptospira interrogans]MBM2890024.1 hypothetical protein [Leptospira interrogans]